MVDIDQALRGLGMGAILSTDEDERTKFLENLASSAEENRRANRHAAEWKDLHKLLRFGGRKAKRMVALPLRLDDNGEAITTAEALGDHELEYFGKIQAAEIPYQQTIISRYNRVEVNIVIFLFYALIPIKVRGGCQGTSRDLCIAGICIDNYGFECPGLCY